jgi:hypothetical protein
VRGIPPQIGQANHLLLLPLMKVTPNEVLQSTLTGRLSPISKQRQSSYFLSVSAFQIEDRVVALDDNARPTPGESAISSCPERPERRL